MKTNKTKECKIAMILAFLLLFAIATLFMTINKCKNKDSIDDTFGLIEVNGEFIDEDDYYQANWKSYTPAKDSIKQVNLLSVVRCVRLYRLR